MMDFIMWIVLLIAVSLQPKVVYFQRTIRFSYLKAHNFQQIFPKDKDACTDKGILVINVRVFVSSESDQKKFGCNETSAIRNVRWNNTEDRLFQLSLKRECNGRHRCELLKSTKYYLPVQCTQTTVDTDGIEINYDCKPFSPNNSNVFDLSKCSPELNIADAAAITSYYILRSESEVLHRRTCHIVVKNGIVRVTLLYVEMESRCFEQPQRIQDYGIKIGHKTLFNCNRANNSLTFESQTSVTLEIFIKSSFIWIEIEGEVKGNRTNTENTKTYLIVSVLSSTLFLLALVAVCLLTYLLHKRRKKLKCNVYHSTNTDDQYIHIYKDTQQSKDNYSHYEDVNSLKDYN